MNTSMFFSIISQLILDFKDKDKRRFVILFAMLTVGMGMNVVNAQSIREYSKEYGDKLEEHSTQLHDLNSKFEIFVAYISTQSERDKEQDERIKRIAKKQDEQGEGIKKLDDGVKKLDHGVKKLDDGVKKQDKRIKTLEEQG